MSNNTVVSVHETHRQIKLNMQDSVLFVIALVIMCIENSLTDYIEASSYHVKI